MPRQTYDKQDPTSIRTLFARIAKRYDLGNSVLSMRLFRRWNRQLIEEVLTHQEPKALLDLCCGTGDIAFTYLKQTESPPETVYMIDFCREMLDHAKLKADPAVAKSTTIHYIVGDAQDIPLPDDSVDAVTIAYGIRNVASPAKCISETYRVLRPGGRLGILELTRPSNPIMRVGHTIYLKTFVPIAGRLLTSDRQAYEYLQKSIRRFIPADDLVNMLRDTGYANAQMTHLTGGIATLITGTKDSS